ncbi:MAG TPA: hypothetical protein VJI75_06560 [Candidatus Nanoarchaeia archaeon]|nr:hypothetical protein [Candidatus Nanoarchaeia archaeon]
MSLCELINRLEAGAPAADDLGHPLALAVVAELGQCEKSEEQRKLFVDARKLADHIIEPYLRLDRQDKLKMAEVYEREKCFRKVGGINSLIQEKLKKKLGDELFLLLRSISNYSKLIPVLERYVARIEGGDIRPKTSTLYYYVLRHGWGGELVKRASPDSLKICTTYNFQNNKSCLRGGTGVVLETMLFGVDDDLKKRMLDAHSLLPVRKRILEQYVRHVESSGDVTPCGVSLSGYLYTHGFGGEEIESQSCDSLQSFAQFDFRVHKSGLHGGKNSVLDSMLHRVDDDLSKRVLDVRSLLSVRKRILANYISWIESKDYVKSSGVSLSGYLRTHGFGGEDVNRDSSDSLITLAIFDFRTHKSRMRGGNPAVVESMLFGITDQDLIAKVRKYAFGGSS